MCRKGRVKGICAIALGAGILLVKVLPVQVLVVLASLAFIILGMTWLKR